MRPDELERRLRKHLDARLARPTRRAAPRQDAPRPQAAERIGDWSYPQSRTFAELLIDREEDRVLLAVLVGMLREGGR